MIFDMEETTGDEMFEFPDIASFPIAPLNYVIGDQNVIMGTNSSQQQSIGGSSQGSNS